jgi:ATP-dependent Lon protease
MTGEITLTGRVLAIGGLREKTMAALRRGVKLVIVPKENEPDIAGIDENVREKLSFSFAETLDEVISLALRMPKKPVKAAKLSEKTAKKAESSKLLRQ